jgi:hypothetical protein|tara:strand:- start:262 stop:462 length:201 start_codon:yes stop_codon:yes gene_type:complete
MDLKDKIISIALASLIGLIGFNLKETWTMKGEIMKLQQGQVALYKKMNKINKVIAKKLKRKNKSDK